MSVGAPRLICISVGAPWGANIGRGSLLVPAARMQLDDEAITPVAWDGSRRALAFECLYDD